MAFLQTVQTKDGLTIENAYWIPRIISFDGAKYYSCIEFNACASASAKFQGKQPLNVDPQKVEVQGAEFIEYATKAVTEAWNGNTVPGDATFFDVVARLAYIVGGAKMLFFKDAVSDSGFRVPYSGPLPEDAPIPDQPE